MSYLYKFPSPVILEVSGLHAERYLHNRLSNNIKALSIGAGCLAGALSPQGRTEALFFVLREASDVFLVLADGGDPAEVIAALKRFLVAERVTVIHREDLSLFHGVFDSQVQIPEKSISRNRTGTPGFDIIASQKPDLRVEEIDTNAYTLLRIKAGLVAFPEDVNSESLLSETGPREAIGFGKGCYPGQEVVEKIDAYGKAPRKIVRVKMEEKQEALKSTMPVRDPETGREIGELLSFAYDSVENQTLGFLLVRANYQNTKFEVSSLQGELYTS